MNKTKYWVVSLSDEDWFVADECSFHLVNKKTLEEISETGYINFEETAFIHSMYGSEVDKFLPESDGSLLPFFH